MRTFRCLVLRTFRCLIVLATGVTRVGAAAFSVAVSGSYLGVVEDKMDSLSKKDLEIQIGYLDATLNSPDEKSAITHE